MAESKKFYWLKLRRDFFKRHDIQVIEAMPNGKDYVLFYLKLMVESIDHDGALRFSDTIPYNEQMLSVITHTNPDIVKAAMEIFVELGMVDILDDRTIYMSEVERMIGSASDNDAANRQRRCRARKKQQALLDEAHDVTSALQNVTPLVTKDNESKRKSKSIEKEIEINSPTDYDFFQTVYNDLCERLPKCKTMTEKRKKLAREFLKVFSQEQWTEVCSIANESAFLYGQNDRGWKADIDFLLRTDKAAKILEGFYEQAYRSEKSGTGFETGNPFLEMRDEMNERSELF